MIGFTLSSIFLAVTLVLMAAAWFLQNRIPDVLFASAMAVGSVLAAGLGLYILLISPAVLL